MLVSAGALFLTHNAFDGAGIFINIAGFCLGAALSLLERLQAAGSPAVTPPPAEPNSNP